MIVIMNSFLMSDISMQEMRVCRQTHSHDVIVVMEGITRKLSLVTSDRQGDREEQITWMNAEEADYYHWCTGLMYE